jgi:hypothetical protein
MSIWYRYNAAYGFLVPENKYALPAEWSDPEIWSDGGIDAELSGSGLVSVYGGDMMTGNRLWGFVAVDTLGSMNKHSDTLYTELRDIDPAVVGNLFDLRARVKMPKARVGWMMWADIS